MTVVRTPASSANLGAGFDVLGLALDLHADIGTGDPPEGTRAVEDHHPLRLAFEQLGGAGPLWLRTSIPMARGLGFSGAVRVGAAALAAAEAGGGDEAITAASDGILRVAAELEGHGDNAAASLYGGVVAYAEDRVVRVRVGPVMAGATVVTWIPDVTTSTDRSRRTLPDVVDRSAAVHNIARSVRLALAFEHDDPELLAGATEDRLHQGARLPLVPGAADALDAGGAAGAWCGWLSGSGPTVALLCPPERASAVAAALPGAAHTKELAIDTRGARVLEATGDA